MLLDTHDHRPGQGCDCAGHDAPPSAKAQPGVWSTLAPVLACAVCPACLTTYGKVLSALGVGVGLSQLQHGVLLVVAVATSLAACGWRTWRTRRTWPIASAGLGAGLVLGGHVADVHAVEWAGVLVLVLGGLTEHVSRQRRRSQAPAPSTG